MARIQQPTAVNDDSNRVISNSGTTHLDSTVDVDGLHGLIFSISARSRSYSTRESTGTLTEKTSPGERGNEIHFLGR